MVIFLFSEVPTAFGGYLLLRSVLRLSSDIYSVLEEYHYVWFSLSLETFPEELLLLSFLLPNCLFLLWGSFLRE